ncbi:MAG: hypothetical protein ACJ8HI_10745 [Massilia sp.]
MRTTPESDPDQLAADLLGEVARSRVPLLLRSPELMALPPPLRTQVLSHARSRPLDPRLLLLLLAYGAACLTLLFLAPRQLGILFALSWIPVWLLHTTLLRHTARNLARELSTT